MTIDQESSLRIISLEAENVKRIKAVRIRPDRSVVRIEGKNAAGKSSVLDAIAAGLGGGRRQPEVPVRKGESRARVIIDMGELIVERRWTAKGNTFLEVRGRDGSVKASPQALLDKLIGDHTYDPLQFVRSAPKVQAELLRVALGIDFSKLDDERDTTFAARTQWNRKAKEAAARAGSAPRKPSDMAPVDLEDLTRQHEQAVAHNLAARDAEALLAQAQVDLNSQGLEVIAMELRLKGEREKMEAIEQEVRARRKVSDALIAVDPDGLPKQIVAALEHNDGIATYHAWETHRDAASDCDKESDQCSDRLGEIDAEKLRVISEAPPVAPGITLAPDVSSVLLNGIPLSQASSAEQLKISVAIGLSNNKRCKVLLIKDGSLLDEESLLELNAIAEEFDAQIFLERVAESASPSAVFIEDGEVRECDAPECDAPDALGEDQ